MPTDDATIRIKETFENWSLYEAVIHHNYMCHSELVDELKTIAATVCDKLCVVDLGCGDSWLATRAFRDIPIERYLAVDLSESAVARGRAKVAFWGPRAELSCGDLAQFAADLPDASANFILASNSLHHFSGASKKGILQHCFRILSPSGTFCWIDPVCNNDESREAYLARLTSRMMNDWTALDEEARCRATRHVWESDWPETEMWMRGQAEETGFVLRERFLRHDLFGGWKFVKP
ncbi:MAG: class I SAM-dependent methyltransferase [Pirellulales bacterium]|nr:class I SAM-dependent methyltransferase [Pirellulales bacterium]